ncbi:MAG: hypothetical protein DMG50_27590 [Acidobacteria bacterium]|nr:MAG: hypothetical protein DMG50_27590 [Acidobacteriota bacterium]
MVKSSGRTGQFYFVAGTYDGSAFKLFVNGVQEGQFAETKLRHTPQF